MTDLSARLAVSSSSVIESPGAHLRYQAHIDGLRAIAIMPVVLYHAGFTTFSGGFVGVDIFFVISGFLITSLIMSDLDSNKFSLLGFYERRIRRIFPALFAVIGACSITAWFVLMPTEFAYFGRSVMAAVLFGSNALFWKEAGYFDLAAQLKPLLHTWSLAVEEQFYIFFPLLLMSLRNVRRSWLLALLAMIAVASFGLNVWATAQIPEFAFYMSPPRFWELVLGAFLALGVLPNTMSRAANELLALFGLALIAVAIFTYSDATSFPGFAVLAPCIGAALIIYSGERAGAINGMLSTRPFVFVGLISYSLYLWHWPIIVFVRYYFGRELSTAQSIWILAASLAISRLSWSWIEQPFRRKQHPISRPLLMKSAIAAMTAAIGFGFVINAYGGITDRLPGDVATVYSAKYDVENYKDRNCFTNSGSGAGNTLEVGGCPLPLGKRNQPPQYIVWGDSHAAAMAPAIEEAADKAGKSGLLVSAGACPPLLDFDSGRSNREAIANCNSANRGMLDLIIAQRIPLVFMVARWPKYSHRSEYGKEGVFFDPSLPVDLDDYSAPLRAAMDATLADLARNGIQTVLVMDVPEMGYDVPDALAKAVLTRSNATLAPSRQIVRQRQALAAEIISSLAVKYRAIMVDPTPELCDQERCFMSKDGVILYHDADHLTRSGARMISHIFDSVFAANGLSASFVATSH